MAMFSSTPDFLDKRSTSHKHKKFRCRLGRSVWLIYTNAISSLKFKQINDKQKEKKNLLANGHPFLNDTHETRMIKMRKKEKRKKKWQESVNRHQIIHNLIRYDGERYF